MDIELFYREKGSGEPLILLHGNGEDGSYFVHQIERFQSRYRERCLRRATSFVLDAAALLAALGYSAHPWASPR